MIEPGSFDPYNRQQQRINGLQEVPGALLRLRRSIRQRSESTVESAQSWLDSAIRIGVEQKIFDPSVQEATIEEKVGTGFNTSVFLFETLGQEWVLKVGAKYAPVPGWFDPSSKEYSQWYSYTTHILWQQFQESLPHLIPWPQYTMYAPNARNEWRSLVIEPYIPDMRPLKDVFLETEDTRQSILTELVIFYRTCEKLYAEHKIIPDLAPGNLGIRKVDGTYRLLLLDAGVIDFNAISPVLNKYSYLLYKYRLKHLINKLERSSKKDVV